MKKRNVITAFACVLCSLVSCSSDDTENFLNDSAKSEVIKVAYIDANGNIINSGDINNQVLCFASEAEYNDFVQKVKQLPNEEKMNVFNNLGFTNLKKIEAIADKELDSIGENCSNEAEFRSKYTRYVNKYAASLEINKFDSSDLSLYVPASSDEEVDPYIVGANKTVVINGQVRKINFKSEMNTAAKRLYGSKSSTSQVVDVNMDQNGRKKINSSLIKATGTNGVIKWVTSSIKIITNFHIEKIKNSNFTGFDRKGYLYFGAQKSMWYGSKRTSRPMFFKLEKLNGCGFTYGYDTYSDECSYIVPLKYKATNIGNPNGPYYGLTCPNHNKKGEFCDIGSESFPIGSVSYSSTLASPFLATYKVTGTYYAWIMVHGERPTQDNMVDLDNYPCVKVNIDMSGDWND